MPSKLRTLIQDKSIADNVVITLPGGEQLTLGQIRAMEAEDQKEFVKQQQELQKQQAEIKAKMDQYIKDQANLKAAQQKTAELFASLQTQSAANSAQPTPTDQDPLAIYENDPAWGPVIKAIRAQNAKMEELYKTHLPKIENTFKQIAKGYIDDRVADSLERIPNRDQKISDEAIISHALQNNFMTRTGIPDVRKAYKDMTAQAERDAEIAKAREQAKRDAYKELGIEVGEDGKPITQPTPRPGFQVTSPQPTNTSFKTLDAALAAAAKDAEIWGPPRA